MFFFFFKQKTAYEVRISDWSSDVCSSDLELAGDLKMFVDESYLTLLQQLSAGGFLDGRYMAATFNSLRGRDLIWNYVVSNYLLGNDYPPFDLLYWNGDVTNLPAKWHRQYLDDLYRTDKQRVRQRMFS